MLDMGQFAQKVLRTVITNQDNALCNIFARFPFFPYQFLTDQVPQGFRPVIITILPYMGIEPIRQPLFHEMPKRTDADILLLSAYYHAVPFVTHTPMVFTLLARLLF